MNYCIFDNFAKNFSSINPDDFQDFLKENNIIIDNNEDINAFAQEKIKDTDDLISYVEKEFENYSDVQINGVIALFCYWYENRKKPTTPEDIELEKTPEDLNAAIIAFVDSAIKRYLKEQEKSR
ncbi:hypothetical protein [Ruminococcus albus]|uniref:Uncharacterized protein n=1 Tax=Ruminococcus albus (strain ATCC 27210 / DSM 20455 / JCM 14654 / NCDO 2250 / 7) TaxID=697329 RepID=E6UGS0_RUMA7|nr:hypothetical protein [Ruminococcus albus]ADU23732.1 hypothetical protein Rumal_3269 [Ruminococcus albus 7 = DSM 20455]